MTNSFQLTGEVFFHDKIFSNTIFLGVKYIFLIICSQKFKGQTVNLTKHQTEIQRTLDPYTKEKILSMMPDFTCTHTPSEATGII